MGGQFTTDCGRPKPTTRLVVIAEKIKVGSVSRSKPSSLTFLAPSSAQRPLFGALNMNRQRSGASLLLSGTNEGPLR
jgi:hypothetical protein